LIPEAIVNNPSITTFGEKSKSFEGKINGPPRIGSQKVTDLWGPINNSMNGHQN
jgi:hypothetical protein